MSQESLAKVTQDIAIVRSMIQTNDKLRQTLFEQVIEENLNSLKEVAPNKNDWRIYDNSAVVTRLYAIYESFVEKLIKDWIEEVPNIFTRYSDLPEKIQRTHERGVAQLLEERQKKQSRFNHFSVENVIRGLYLGVTGNHKYELISGAFLFHSQNLRKDALQELLANAGIPDSWKWIENYRDIKNFIEKVRNDENTADGELQEFINYRNEAAHGDLDSFQGAEILLELCDFVAALCQAIAELIDYQILQNRKIQEIGRITRWFPEREAARAKVKETTLSVGESLFLVSQEKGYCQQVTIESIMIDEEEKEQVKIGAEREIGLKFNAPAREGLSLYPID